MIVVEIREGQSDFIADFFGKEEARQFGGSVCRLHGVPGSPAFESDVVRIVVENASNVAAGLVAAALYDSLKKARIPKIWINGRETPTERERIEPYLSKTEPPIRDWGGTND